MSGDAQRRLIEKARAALARGDADGARRQIERELRRTPRAAALHAELGRMHLSAADPVAARACFEQAVRHAPGEPAAHSGLGMALLRLGRYDEALAAFEQSARLAPDLAPTWFNLGIARRESGDYAEAIEAYDRSIALDPKVAAVWYNRGNALTAAGAFGEAVTSFERARALKPDYPEAEFNKGIALLLAGELARGWVFYDARWRARTFDTPARFSDLPRWDGRDPAGRRILVWGEQGVGDEMRYLTMLPDLVAAGAQVTFCGDPRLGSLVARAFPGVSVATEPPAALVGTFDAQLPVGGLGRWFRKRFDAFPTPVRPHFAPDPGLRAHWHTWLADLGDRPKIGISWRTGRDMRRKRARYAPMAEWAAFARTLDAAFVCLQYGDCDADVAAFAREHGLVVHMPPGLDRRDDFEGMAGLYAALDAVVSAPNTIADLAGSLGVPTWVVVHAPHWPWPVWDACGPAGQCWYASLRMVDARAEGGWPAAFARVRSELARYGTGGADHPSAART